MWLDKRFTPRVNIKLVEIPEDYVPLWGVWPGLRNKTPEITSPLRQHGAGVIGEAQSQGQIC